MSFEVHVTSQVTFGGMPGFRRATEDPQYGKIASKMDLSEGTGNFEIYQRI